MTDFKASLLNVLDEIKGSGSFVSNGTKPFLFPGLTISGMDEIGFPINAVQIKEMIKVAHKAPFGKGSETLLDTTVRSAWEINADVVKFRNNDWEKFIENIIAQIKPDLGIEEHSVTANLYKLLIYEKDDFFVAHKDSEKEKGMFGTLIIGLPSAHTGGELSVSFDGKKKIIDFAEPANQYKLSFAAFYADCEHAIKPITSGYRVCLVYNLVQNKGKEKIELNPLGSYVERLAAVLKLNEEDKDVPKIVLLGHQYTPANFTMEVLKLNDRPKAEALIQAAQKAGFYSKLGLVTSYQMGALDMDSNLSSKNSSRRGYYYDDDYNDEDLAKNGTMGEVYDEGIRIEHWMADGVPPLRNIEFKEENLISTLTLNEDEPVEKFAEGYTGNAGMEMAYWYHYGAVFLWPKKHHYELLLDLNAANKLEWLDYYNKHWESLGASDIAMTKQLAESGLHNGNLSNKVDFNPLVDWLINLNDHGYVLKRAPAFLTDCFKLITVEGWVKLFETYPSKYFERMFTALSDTGNIAVIKHILAILSDLLVNKVHACDKFILDQIERMPVYLNSLGLSFKSNHAAAKNILLNILELERLKASDVEWLKKTTAAFTGNLNRTYVNDVLMAEILKCGKKTTLAKQIIAVCKDDLTTRANNQPQPPADWSRSVPQTTNYKRVWSILSNFLKSPELQIFDYQRAQGDRSEMESAIANVTIDLRTETIKKGSPHTLRLIKTQNAYESDMAKWKTDVSLLKKTEEWQL